MTLRFLSRLPAVLDELRRRKVVRVVVAYVVFAAALIQVGDSVLPWIDADPLVMKVLIVLALGGVPVAVFLSWAYDVVPDRGPAAKSAAGAAGSEHQEHVSRSTRRRLPAASTPFIGRRAELRELIELLRDPSQRLITVTGTGGVGKTRLALEAARQVAPVFADGVVYTPLSGLASPRLLVPTLAESMGLRAARRDEPLSEVLDFLRDKELLLILDNFDHLREGTELLLTLIEAAPKVQLLVTSRERLRVSAETLLGLDGLALGNGGDHGTSEAAALFLTAARRLDRSIGRTSAGTAEVHRICDLLGGLPLALELAASWVRVLSCSEIVAELEQSLDLLSESAPHLPERSRSLRASFDGSWRLLTPHERHVLAALSVFRGSFDREAAANVADADVALLGQLLDKSLLTRVEGMFLMGDVVRQYAGERLAVSHETHSEVQKRHVDHYASLLQSLQPDLLRSEPAAITCVAARIDDVRAAWRHAADTGAAGALLRMIEGVFLFHEARGWAREGATAFEQAQAALQDAAATDDVVPLCRARLSTRLGVFRHRLGEADAVDELRRAVAAARALGDRPEEAFALDRLGAALASTGAYDEAERLHREAQALHMEIGDRRGTGWSLTHLGNVALPRGRYEEAARLYEEALEILSVEGDRNGRWVALNNLGIIAVLQNDYGVARHHIFEAIELQEELGNKRSMATLRHNLGCAALAADDRAEARRHLEAGLAISEELGYRRMVAQSLLGLADLALREDDVAEAHTVVRRALQKAAAAQNKPIALEALLRNAQVLERSGDTAGAARLATVVATHPASEQDARQKARELLTQLGGIVVAEPLPELDRILSDNLSADIPSIPEAIS